MKIRRVECIDKLFGPSELLGKIQAVLFIGLETDSFER